MSSTTCKIEDIENTIRGLKWSSMNYDINIISIIPYKFEKEPYSFGEEPHKDNYITTEVKIIYTQK